MAKSRARASKIELHGNGVSGFSPEDIERRAGELALIDNRTEATDQDRELARGEFQDLNLPDAINEDAESMQSMSRDPSDPMADRGHQAPEYGGDDEKTALEKLALEGVEEAQHEQMIEARNAVDEPLSSRPKRRPVELAKPGPCRLGLRRNEVGQRQPFASRAGRGGWRSDSGR